MNHADVQTGGCCNGNLDSRLKAGSLRVTYINENRIYNEGCKDGYVVAHYQSPREMLCLWQKLLEGHEPVCCSGR